MRLDFRIGLFVGLSATVIIGAYCYWLSDRERQVLRHSENLFRRVEQRNWTAVGDLIAPDYADQWGNDRETILERLRLILANSHGFRIHAADVSSNAGNGLGTWRGRITIESDDPELMAAATQRINSLTAPFECQWRHVSGKRSDWKLVRVGNPELEIPAGLD